MHKLLRSLKTTTAAYITAQTGSSLCFYGASEDAELKMR